MNRLSPEEINFFKREGYLIKKGVLDPDLMARARECKWAGAPDRMKPDDPTTWIGPWRPDEETPEAEDNCRVRALLAIPRTGARGVDSTDDGGEPHNRWLG